MADALACDVLAIGRTFAFAAAGERACVTILWGAPDAVEARAMIAAWRAEHLLGPHVALFDASAVNVVSAEAFDEVRAYELADRARLTCTLTRKAIVFPSGQSGATVAGYHVLFREPYPTEVFADRAAALAWLGLPELAAPVAALIADVAGDDAIGALRRWLLDAELADAELATAAAALARSPRSLQRHLADAGTTFDRERVRAQLARAQRLMRRTDASLTEIAIAVGCASLSSFSELFRRELGTPPSEWRRARAASAGDDDR